MKKKLIIVNRIVVAICLVIQSIAIVGYIAHKMISEASDPDQKEASGVVVGPSSSSDDISPRERAKRLLENVRTHESKVESSNLPPVAPDSKAVVGSSASSATLESQNARSEVGFNIGKVRSDHAFVYYGDKKIPKLGFGQDGVLKDPASKHKQVKELVERITSKGEKFSFVYPATTEEKMKAVVFTDPTCPHCTKLHENLDDLRSNGVSVYYLMYPRTLIRGERDPQASRVLDMFEWAWCSSNPNRVLDHVFATKVAPSSLNSCSAPEEQGRVSFPYSEHFFIGSLVDVGGTPTILTSTGKKIVGFKNVSDFMEAAR